MNALFILVGGYLAILAAVYAFQAKLVYFPTREVRHFPTEVGLLFQPFRLKTADGPSIAGWLVPGPGGALDRVVLFCHGNGGNIGHRLDTLRIFHELGLAAAVFDYRGYGESEGAPSEEGTYRDAEAVWHWLKEDKGVEPRDIVVWGRSLGGAVAAWLAREKNPGGLVLESTFTSAPDVGARAYPFLPVRLLSRFRYDTREYVNSVRCPTLVMHSPQDEIVPYDIGRQVFEAAPNATFFELSGGHNDGFLVSETSYKQAIREFLARLGRGGEERDVPTGS